jgi:PAS domain S-box-containing protein
MTDVTDRRRGQELEQQLASIVESSDDAIVSKDLDGVIITWNRGAERLFGYKAEEVIGKSVTILIPPDRHDEEPRILEQVRRGERIDHYETVRRRRDGSLVEISLTVSPVSDAEGKIIGASKIARDKSPAAASMAGVTWHEAIWIVSDWAEPFRTCANMGTTITPATRQGNGLSLISSLQ